MRLLQLQSETKSPVTAYYGNPVTAHFVAPAQFVVGDKLYLRWGHISSPPCIIWRLATKCAAVAHTVLGRQNVLCKSAYFVVPHRMDLNIHSDIYLLTVKEAIYYILWYVGPYILYSLCICTCTNTVCVVLTMLWVIFVSRFLLVDQYSEQISIIKIKLFFLITHPFNCVHLISTLHKCLLVLIGLRVWGFVMLRTSALSQ